MKTNEIEIAIARHFGTRQNIIVPNVSWGLNFIYELDLIIVNLTNYVTEVEIKISISDIKAECKKSYYAHKDDRIKRLYFAVPDYISEKAVSLIPKNAGLLVVNKDLKVRIERLPIENLSARKLSDNEIINLSRLATMRVWNLKEKLMVAEKQIVKAKLKKQSNETQELL